MPYAPKTAPAVALALLGLLPLTRPASASPWLPVPPEDLQMTSEARAPGASAIILYRQDDRDDASCFEHVYNRIKILTDEGRKQGNVELAFDGERQSIRAIEARTVHPDGTIVPFDGTVYDSTVVQAQGDRVLAKTFTLPAVEVGSIIEYRYEERHSCQYLYDSRWILSADLFVRDARFSLTPDRHFTLRWTWPRELPEATQPPKLDHGVVRMEAHNLPAFVTEPFMPPANELRQRVDFVYSEDQSSDPEVFWKHYGQKHYRSFESFASAGRALREALAQILQPQDSPQMQLRKIYARVQQLRNVSYETQSQREASAEKADELHDVADVLKRGYGNTRQLCFLFVALARAAGIAADPVLISTRNRYFFDPRVMNAQDLNMMLAVAHVEGADLFLQPAIPYLPFGVLPWDETQVQGLRLDDKGGAWVTTPLPPPEASRTERQAKLRISADGVLSGKVTVTYSGWAAAVRRLETRRADDKQRLAFLRREIGLPGPQGMGIKVVSTPDWSSTDAPLVVEYEVRIRDWVQKSAQRELLPVGLFGRAEQHMFEHDTRVHPLYFAIPHLIADDISIEVPERWSVSSLPKPRKVDLTGLRYQSTAENQGNSLHLSRELMLNLTLVDVKLYEGVQNFYQNVRTGDEDPVVLSSDARSAQ